MLRTSITICSECFVYEKFAATHYLIKKGSDGNKSRRRAKQGSGSERGEDKVRVPSRAWLCIMYNGVQHKLVFI